LIEKNSRVAGRNKRRITERWRVEMDDGLDFGRIKKKRTIRGKKKAAQLKEKVHTSKTKRRKNACNKQKQCRL